MAVEIYNQQPLAIISRNQTIIIILMIGAIALLFYSILTKPKIIHLERDEKGRLIDVVTT